MTNKDILICNLNEASEILDEQGNRSWYNLIQEAISLLKSQPEIIYCENCKHWNSQGVGFCKKYKHFTTKDWFCKDGEV